MGTGKEETKTLGEELRSLCSFDTPLTMALENNLGKFKNIFLVPALQTIRPSRTNSVMRCHGQIADVGKQY